MRPTLLLTLCLLQVPCNAADSPRCDSESQTWNSRSIVCTVADPGSDSERRYEFTARFSGGHDDTMASMQPLLDDRPLTCDAGSKLDLFAEEGDVSLFCRFTVNGPGERRLTFAVRWSHAEYMNVELTALDEQHDAI